MATKQKYFRLNALTGGINSVAEENDLASFDFNNQGVQSEARDIENWRILHTGGQTKASGYSLYQAVPCFPITGLYRYNKADGTNYFLYSGGKSKTKVYKLVSGVSTDIGMTVTCNTYLSFETALNKLIVCDGVVAPQVWDGATVTALTCAPSVLKQTLFYQNRLWGIGDTANPSLLYYSCAGVTSGMKTNFVNCDVNDGQSITGIAKFYLATSIQPVILVGKSRSVGIVTGTGTNSDPYTFAKINFDFGLPGFRQFVQYGQNIAYLTPVGIASYMGGYAFMGQTKLLYEYISEKIRDQFLNFNATTLANALCWHDYLNYRITYALPEGSNTYNNVLWHYDYRFKSWYKERWPSGSYCTAAFVDTNGTLYHGDSKGNIFNHASTIYDFNGSPINAYYTTPYLDFGMPSVKKRIVEAKITMRTQGTYNLGISSKFDYGDRSNPTTNTIQVTGGNYTWNGGTWTSDPTVYQWGAAPITTKRFFPTGWFNSIQLTLTQPGVDQPLDIFEIDFLVEYQEMR